MPSIVYDRRSIAWMTASSCRIPYDEKEEPYGVSDEICCGATEFAWTALTVNAHHCVRSPFH
ncbi:hypothetical protein AVEN_40292-1, partial [Araneus ventricosus]